MGSRLELQNKLEEILGSKNVYYQPPESLKMNYPAIRYSKDGIDSTKADDINYLNHKRYEIIVIDRRPDNSVIDELLKLPMCSYDRPYVSDNLHHDVLTLYY